MRIFKYLIGIWVAVAVYTLFSFLSGPRGLSAYNQLSFERDQQLANIRELGFINEELTNTKNNLLFDHDTLMVHARQLGFGQENERFIRIVGLGTPTNNPSVVGNLYIVKNPDYIPNRTIQIIAIIAGFLMFAFLLMLEVIDNRVK